MGRRCLGARATRPSEAGAGNGPKRQRRGRPRSSAIPMRDEESATSTLAGEARELIALIALGRKLGLMHGACPLCSTSQSTTAFENGLASAEAIARRLDEEAARE